MREFKPSSVGDDTFDVCGRCHSMGQRATMRHIWWCDDMEKLEAVLLAEREKVKRLREAGQRLVNAMLAVKSFKGPSADSDANMLTGIMWANLKAALSEAGEE